MISDSAEKVVAAEVEPLPVADFQLQLRKSAAGAVVWSAAGGGPRHGRLPAVRRSQRSVDRRPLRVRRLIFRHVLVQSWFWRYTLGNSDDDNDM